GFFSARILTALARDGNNRHWLIRAKKNLRWRTLQRLGPRDAIVEMDVSKEARRKDPSLPETWVMRAITYQRKGVPPQTLLTSLLDPGCISRRRDRADVSRALGAGARLRRDQDRVARPRRGHPQQNPHGCSAGALGHLPRVQPRAARNGTCRRGCRRRPHQDQLRGRASPHL